MIRKYLHIDLSEQSVKEEVLEGEAIIWAGRNLIAKTLAREKIASVDPLSRDNLLIFSAGPLAGTNFSNANRISVGCKSPLTGGIKEANSGGNFAMALGQLNIAGFTLYEASDDWVVIHLSKNGTITFSDATSYLGKGNFEAAALLHEKYGKKVSFSLCGPVGEYQGLLAGISFSDTDRRPSRLAARGGVGAVMGAKKVKAIVVELSKMPALHERKKVMSATKQYATKLGEDAVVDIFKTIGTAGMADYTNHIGGMPVRNFSNGRLHDTDVETLKIGGDYIRDQNIERGGKQSHACMPGCMIQCSNVYVDAEGKELVSPLEYETIGLMGSNCGVSEPDDIARLNYIANDLGIDSIETGATLGVLMEAGLAAFGDIDFLFDALEEIRQGTDKGRLWAQGTARVGKHYQVKRVPVIKKQALSAYDPRVILVTGISMMLTAQGADHTTGNVPYMDGKNKGIEELVAASMESQVMTAATDSLGLCNFGRTVTNPNLALLCEAINSALATSLQPVFFAELGRETLKLEAVFNKKAGFTQKDDELPAFFYEEPLAPTNKVALFHGQELHEAINDWWKQDT